MRPKRRSKGQAEGQPGPVKKNAPITIAHFRLCHMCHYLNESESAIVHCSQCQHLLSLESINPGDWRAVREAMMGESVNLESALSGEDPGEADDEMELDSAELEGDLPSLTGLSARF